MSWPHRRPGNFQTPGFVTLAIPPREPNPAGTTPFGGPTYAETGVTPGAFNPFNPFNQIISGGSRARLAEFGNRLFDNETDAFLGTFGFRGDKLFNGTWGYDTGFRYSEVKNTTTGTQVSSSRFNRILNQADPIFNPASSEYIGTTIAFNPFGDFRVPIPSNARLRSSSPASIQKTSTRRSWPLSMRPSTRRIFSICRRGELALPLVGNSGVSRLRKIPTRSTSTAISPATPPIATAVGGRKSYAFFVETSIPVFSEKNAITGFHALEINAAGRYEEFRNNDTTWRCRKWDFAGSRSTTRSP